MKTTNSAPAFKIGDPAIHIEDVTGREICRVTIARETATQWIDERGGRWRKLDGAQIPQYVSPRFIVPVPA